MAPRKRPPITDTKPDTTLPAPTAEYVWSLYRLKKDEGPEARLRLLATEMRLLTEMRHPLNIPVAYQAITKQVRTPFLRDTWHRTVAALNVKPYVVHIEPRDQRNDTDRAANIGERWDTAVRESLDKEIGEDTSVESSKAIVRDGESVLKVVHRPDAWANFPEREDDDADTYSRKAESYKKGSPLPFAWRIVDRLSMLFGDGEFGDDWALEYGEYPTPYLGRRFGMEQDPQDEKLINPARLLGGKPKPEGMLVTSSGRSIKLEYFDADWYHVVIDGQDAPGFPVRNPYAPRLPYFRAKGPDSESLLYSLLFLVPALDELLTMKLNWSYLGAYPNPIIHQLPSAMAGMPLGDDGVPPRLTWKPGQAQTLPPGWTMDFLAPPPVGKDLNDLVSLLRGLIDIAGIPSVFRGEGGADQAGYAINQLMAAASLAFKLAAESQSRQFSRGYEFLHWMIPHVIKQPVYLLAGAGDKQQGKQWLALKPEGPVTATEASVEDLGPVDVTIRPTLPTDEQANAMIALQLVNAPKQLLSRKRALEKYLQEEDPEGVLDEIAVENAMEQPPLQQIWLNRALQNAGLEPPPNTPATPTGEPDAPDSGPIPGGPSVPGVNMPLAPTQPGQPTIQAGQGGSPAGSFPGSPSTPVAVGG